MPINMAMEEPRPRIIGDKTNRNLISPIANADYVAQYRVVPVIGTVPGTADDVERMAMKMDRMLARCHGLGPNAIIGQELTGPPSTPAGIVNSTTSLRLSP
jgi:hypothetical protein